MIQFRRGLEILERTNNNMSSEAAESISKNNPQLKSLLLGEVAIMNMEGIHQSKLTPNDY